MISAILERSAIFSIPLFSIPLFQTLNYPQEPSLTSPLNLIIIIQTDKATVTPSAVLARPQHVVDKQEELKRLRLEDRHSSNKSSEPMSYSETVQNEKQSKFRMNNSHSGGDGDAGHSSAPHEQREKSHSNHNK